MMTMPIHQQLAVACFLATAIIAVALFVTQRNRGAL